MFDIFNSTNIKRPYIKNILRLNFFKKTEKCEAALKIDTMQQLYIHTNAFHKEEQTEMPNAQTLSLL